MSCHRYTISDELRHSTRFIKERGTDCAVLWFGDGEPLLVDVHDESLGGLGLYLDNVEGINAGIDAKIICGGQFMTARVSHIELQPDGGYVAGFEWVPELKQPTVPLDSDTMG